MNLNEAIQNAKPGDTINVPAGTHAASLVIDKPLTLKGEGPGRSIIDARRAGPTILVAAESGKVSLIGLSLLNGSSPQGGCIAFVRGDELWVEDCLLEGGVCRS